MLSTGTVIVLMVTALLFGACGSQGMTATSTTVPKAVSAGGVVEVTGYRKLTLDDGSLGPVTVIVKGRSAEAIRSAIAGLTPIRSLRGCMETVSAFKINFLTHRGGRPTAVATEEDCPTPGVVILSLKGKTKQYLEEDCALRAAIISSLPRGQAEGTKRDRNPCSV